MNRKGVASLNSLLVTAAAAKSVQSCPTLCDPTEGSPPGSPVPGILQARTLEWIAVSFSNAGKWKVKVKSLRRVRLCVTPWTAAYQAPPSMGFSRQEYWSGVPLLVTTDLETCQRALYIVWYMNEIKGRSNEMREWDCWLLDIRHLLEYDKHKNAINRRVAEDEMFLLIPSWIHTINQKSMPRTQNTLAARSSES